jgi:iron(III) transport system substrate-binding protein
MDIAGAFRYLESGEARRSLIAMKKSTGWKLILLAVALYSSKPVLAQDAKLIDAAKKEGGRVVIYGSIENDTMDLIAAPFKKKTGIEVDYWRAAANKVMDRVTSESRAGKPQADVVLTTTSTMKLIQKDGLLAKYDSPSAKFFPKTVIDPNLGPAYRSTVIGVVYNTSLVKPSEAPQSLEDIVKPQYKGKVVFPDPSQHTTTAQWLNSLQKIMGKEKADKFIHELAASKPLLVSSLTPAGERITTGETPLGVAFLKNVVFYGKKGVPLDYVRLGKFLGDGQSVTLAAKAPHPSAGS